MENKQHFFAGKLLKKTLSVTLAATILLSMVLVGNVFGTTAFAAETQTEGDYTFVILDNGTARITKYNGAAAQLTTPAKLGGVTVTEIGARAFENNDEIVSVTFPNGVSVIGEYAFTGCDLLDSITFASSVTEIGAWAFDNCKALQSVEIPSTVKTIRGRAFNNCPILTNVTLNEGLERLENSFLAGTAVSEIYIPSTVTYANEAFANMELLETVSFAEGITAIPEDMFENNNSIRHLTIPDTVTKLGKDSFAHMRALESIVIPDSVTEMGDYVFYECDKLASVTIGKGVTYIPGAAFERCVSLKKITIPGNVTAIGNAAFKDCSRLATLTLSEGLVDIGSYSFERTAVKEVTIPSTLARGSYPFNGCDSLKTTHFAAGTTALVTGLYQNTKLESVTIPEGITELPNDLFRECKKLKSVTLPSTLRTIKASAFEGCTVLDNVDIPQSVKKIEGRAFARTESLTNFTLHEGIQTMDGYIFAESALTSVYIPKTLSTTNEPFANSNITDVTFSSGIATLTDSLFANAGKLTEVTIPDTVVKIGSRCFLRTNLETVVIPDNVKTIGSSAFEECDNLYVAKFGSGVRKLPTDCFYGCDVLQNVIIPETVVDMENAVFERSGLCYLKLPQSLRYIPSYTFKDCAKLAEVECSDQLESIGDYAFERCYSLTKLTSAAEPDFNDSSFKDCPLFTDRRFYVFNPENTGIESTGNVGTDHTLVHFTVKYDIRDDWEDEDINMHKLYLNLPDNLELVTSSFAAEGFGFDIDTYAGDYKSFSLADGQTTGELRFSAYLNSSNDAVKNVSAEVEFDHSGTYFRKPLGEVQFTTAKLSLFAPSTVATPAVTVSGYSVSADKAVTVYVSRLNKDGSKDCTVSYTVTPNKYTGKYISDALNIVPADKTAVSGDRFEVYAECNGARSEVTSFTYIPGALKVVKATETVNITEFIAPHTTNLSHGSQANTYDITGIFTKGTSPVVMINPAEMIKFEFDFENDEDIAQMVLMSHRGDDWRFMQLFYDAETDLWIGEGYFNIFDHELVSGYNYVPGALNLYFVRGEREDTYRSHFYGKSASHTAEEPVGEKPKDNVFYYDSNGQPHGDPGDYHETAISTLISVIIDTITLDWGGALSDTTTGGLHGLWQWGVTNDNGFAFLHGGHRIGRDGSAILKGDDMYNRNAKNDGRQRNAIDPSGVVYEAVEGNYVEGATATIYKLNEETGIWETWNAADYEQQNPLLTNNEGAYAWMTDEGKFKVTVSKEGYETVTSEEFDVPPEKLHLNFNLVDKTTQPVATVTKNAETGSYTLKFSKFMKPETVSTDTVQIEGLSGVRIVPVYLNEGDAYADTFTVTGAVQQSDIKFTVTSAAQSYSGVSATASTETITESGVSGGILGDVDGDGLVTITDATIIQKYIAEYELPNPALIERCGDVDGNGQVTINDATTIQKYLAEYAIPYPIGEPMA